MNGRPRRWWRRWPRGELRKAVLSRTVTLPRPAVSDVELFVRLAARYPSAFVSWVHLPGGSRWIGATPETLLDYDGRELSTMALAGTRRAGSPGEWGRRIRTSSRLWPTRLWPRSQGSEAGSCRGEPLYPTGRSGGASVHARFGRGPSRPEQLTRVLSALHPHGGREGIPKRLRRSG